MLLRGRKTRSNVNQSKCRLCAASTEPLPNYKPPPVGPCGCGKSACWNNNATSSATLLSLLLADSASLPPPSSSHSLSTSSSSTSLSACKTPRGQHQRESVLTPSHLPAAQRPAARQVGPPASVQAASVQAASSKRARPAAAGRTFIICAVRIIRPILLLLLLILILCLAVVNLIVVADLLARQTGGGRAGGRGEGLTHIPAIPQCRPAGGRKAGSSPAGMPPHSAHLEGGQHAAQRQHGTSAIHGLHHLPAQRAPLQAAQPAQHILGQGPAAAGWEGSWDAHQWTRTG